VQGLAFDPNTNTLYGVDGVVNQILTIDTDNGAGEGIGPADQLSDNGFGNVTGLAFDPKKGVLYGVDSVADQLLTINTSDGTATGIGAAQQLALNGFGNVDALAIPEPSTFFLAALGLLSLVLFGRQRKR